jgi:desulfoferrodoxin (superoxide reductase-like protein)
MNNDNKHGIRWIEFKGKNGQMVTKEKFFNTEAELEKFAEKLAEKDNFHQIEAYTEPRK